MAAETRTWGGLVLETRAEYGHAARRNRGRYAGRKIHRLISEYVVGLEPGYVPAPGTVGERFLTGERKLDAIGRTVRTPGVPVLFACRPACGCCQGQHGGSPSPGLTAESVTCDTCRAATAAPPWSLSCPPPWPP